ncbi:MAG: DUF3159 domain-containing protein [Actinomycetota bacterium]|nr:DUF3159 domain-containing protein [Actinomycetota bacterium]
MNQTPDHPGSGSSPSRKRQHQRTIDSVMPIVAFLVLNRWVSLGWAVAGATGWSIKAAVSRRRHGETVGRFLPLLVAYLVIRGVIGIITDSEAVYFGIGIGTKALIGFVLIGTVVVGRPFLAKVLPLAVSFGADTVADPIFDRTMGRLTVALGAYQLLTSVWDIWLYNQTSADGYVAIRALVGWPAGFAFSCLGLWYTDRALRHAAGFPGLLDLLDPEAGGGRG